VNEREAWREKRIFYQERFYLASAATALR